MSKALAKTTGERRGGFRANAGRKPGSENQKTAAIAAQARDEGITPIEVLLKNMRFYDERAEAFQSLLEDSASLLTPAAIAAGGEQVLEVLKLIQKMVNFRTLAEDAAVAAAPYCHPRLASVEFKDRTLKPSQPIDKLMSPKDAARRYMETLEGAPVPR